MELANANTLIFGATGGLGTELTKQLSAAGSQVCATSRTQQKLDELTGASIRTKPADVRSPEEVAAVFEWAVAQLGGLDLVVNATGLVAFGPVEDLSVDAMEELFMVNAFAHMQIGKQSLNHLGTGGTLVGISGVIAEQNLPNMAAYGASKAAAKAFSDGLRREARRKKINVIDARPGHTETGLAARAIEGTAPKFPQGLDPAAVVSRILKGVTDGESELASAEFR